MNRVPIHLNLLAAWIGILLGFASGLGLGLFFHQDSWLGGYASFKRRLYRLGHISFFALGIANLCFYFTARELAESGPGLVVASWAFMVGAAAMPICCVLTAHRPIARFSFGVPVLSLLLGGLLVVLAVAGNGRMAGAARPALERVAPISIGAR